MKQFTLEEKNEVLENPFIHIHRKLDVLLNIGKLLMECGADTNRIIEEMLKSATFMGIPHNCYLFSNRLFHPYSICAFRL